MIGSAAIRQRRASRGFTLLELLIVLVIGASLMAVAPPLITRAMPGMELKSATRHVASALRYARSRSASAGEEMVISFDLEARKMTTQGQSRPYQIADAVKVEVLTAESETEGEKIARIRFYPDGGATGGRVTLSLKDNPERKFGVDVDWLTGRIRILE